MPFTNPGGAEPRELAEVASFHAHIYFGDGGGREAALWLRAAIAERFAVRLGTVHAQPVGPHASAMYQVAFAPDLFGALVPWLMLNHRGLSVLVHPNTRNQKRDHLVDALWIGTRLAVDPAVLPEDEEPEGVGTINTEPHRAA